MRPRSRTGTARVAALLLMAMAPLTHAGDAFDERFGVREERLSFPLVLTVGLQEDSERVVMDAAEEARLRRGGAVVTVAPREPVVVERVEGSPARIRYAVCLATFDPARLEEADARVAELEAGGHDAWLLPWGARLRRETGELVHDHRRVFVAVAETEELEQAEAWKQEWVERGERPFFHEALVTPGAARLSVRVGEGEPVVVEGPVSLASPDGVVRVHDVKYGVGQPWGGTETREYRGSVALTADRSGTLATVNTVELEAYLRGVVPSEIQPSSPMPALKAQAVAARGETLAKYHLRHTPDPYEVCSSVRCQVYSGKTRETHRTNLAVLRTRGEVMRHGTHIVDAVYGAVCGGHTEHNDMVWSSPPDPALRGRADGEDVASPVTASNLDEFLSARAGWCRGGGDRFRWTREMNGAELREALEARGYAVGRLRDVELGPRGVSGRLRSLVVVGDAGRVTIRKELPIRRAFGGLRSALFALDLTRDSTGGVTRAVFRGAGWGHGVGLCQVGARAQAAAGVPYDSILESYFHGIHVERVDRPAGGRAR